MGRASPDAIWVWVAQSMTYISVFGEIILWPPGTAEKYLIHGVLEGGDIIPHLLNTVHPTLTTVLSPSPLHTNTLSPILMAYFDNNIYHSAPAAGNLDDTNCYPFTPAVENFDAYQQWSSILAPETAGIQTLDNLTEYWDTVEQPSPTAGPSTDVSVPDDYGKHHNHCLVDWCLTCGLQIRRLWQPRIRPTPTASSSHYTPGDTRWSTKVTPSSMVIFNQINTGRKPQHNHSRQTCRTGTLFSPTGLRWKCLSSSQPLVTVRIRAAHPTQ